MKEIANADPERNLNDLKARGKQILEELSRTRSLTKFEFRALFFGAT